MGLFDFVEENDRVRTSAYGFGELAAIFVSDVSWRRTDQSSDGMWLRVLRHVNSDQVTFLAIVQLRKQCLGELRFSHSSRSQEEEGPRRLGRTRQSGLGSEDAIHHLLDGRILSNDASSQACIELQQTLLLRLVESGDWNSRPACDDFGNVFCRDRLVQDAGFILLQHRGLALGFGFFQARQLASQVGNCSVLQVGCLLVVAHALGLADLGFVGCQAFLDFLELVGATAICLPLCI
mmetsp:Transcript_5091/g.14882  ORF Transcript_5091/g.14882 Transcript_5091/m.14882 type:complete len:236 (-) Transcript_5091:82-789(-)